MAQDNELTYRGVEVDASGRARVSAIRPGSYELVCEPDDLVLEPAVWQVAAQPQEQRVRVTLRSKGAGR